MDYIVWKKPDGGAAVTSIFDASIDPEQHAAELLARGDVPADYELVGINVPLPPLEAPEMFDAMKVNARKEVVLDSVKVNEVRAARAKT